MSLAIPGFRYWYMGAAAPSVLKDMNDRDVQHLPCCRVEEQLPEKAGFSRSVMSRMRLAIAANCAFCLEAFRPWRGCMDGA
jgi:hypothetical protein